MNIEDIAKTSLVKDPTFTTWIYVDQQNNDEITEPIQGIVDENGQGFTEKFMGGQYLKFNRTLDAYVVQERLPEEPNSDLSLETKLPFFRRALEDCVQQGSNEFFVMFGSHASGFQGFGFDDTPRGGGDLMDNIVTMLQTALADVPGAPNKLDVMGFDACLMMNLNVMDKALKVAKYFLASEFVIPGDGLAYPSLTAENSASSALDMAKILAENFDGYTISLVESTAYEIFIQAWSALFQELGNLMTQDTNLAIYLSRVNHETVIKNWLRPGPAVDVGWFLEMLQDACQPQDGSALAALLQDALDKYKVMFTLHLNPRQGTLPVTGSQIIFPDRSKKNLGNFYFFQDVVAPGLVPFNDFLLEFIQLPVAGAPTDISNSICSNPLSADVFPNDGLMGNITVNYHDVAGGVVSFEVPVSYKVDELDFYLGLDVSSTLNKEAGSEILLGLQLVNRDPPRNSNSYRFNWDLQFGVLFDEAGDLFAPSLGEGTTKPSGISGLERGQIMYFAPGSSVETNGLAPMTTIDDAVNMGGQEAFLFQDADGSLVISLLTGVPAPYNIGMEAGGKFAPIIGRGNANTGSFEKIVGSLDRADVLFDWSPDATWKPLIVNPGTYLTELGLSDLYAFARATDDDGIDANGNVGPVSSYKIQKIPLSTGTNVQGPSPTTGTTTGSSPTTSSGHYLWSGLAWSVVALGMTLFHLW